MRITSKQVVTQDVVTDVICNNCGGTCKAEIKDSQGQVIGQDFYGLIELKVSGGFFSTHLEDNTSYTFSLCEKCLVDKVFKGMKHAPDTKEGS